MSLSQHSLSFLAAAVAFGIAAFWPAKRPEPAWRTAPLRLALGATAIWGLLLAPASHGLGWAFLPGVEWLRYAAWLFALPALRIAARPDPWVKRFNLTVALGGLLLAPFSLVLAAIALAFASLVNIEQLLRNAEPEQMPGIKLCAIALGGIFAYDLYSYSELMLLANADSPVWRFRGFVNAALLPVLGVGIARLTRVRSNLFVSRQAVFYSTAFLAVGVYLIGIAAAAQYLRARGGAHSDWLQPLLLGGAALVLVVLLASESPWRRLKVFLAKHFYSNKYDYRVEWLRFVRNLGDGEAADARVTAVRAIAQIFESPGGVLFQREEGDGAYAPGGFWSAQEEATPALSPVPLAHPMIRFMVQKGWVIDLDEYRRDPAIYASIELPAFLLRADAPWRIVSPLFDREALQGFIVLQRPPPPFSMTYEDRDLLRMVGRHVATLLSQQASDRRLAESRQFDAFNRFAAFVMHDLKNAVAQLELLASNAKRHRHNPEFIDDAFATIENTSARITRLITQLQAPKHALVTTAAASIGEVMRVALARCAAQPPRPECALEDEAACVMVDPERLAAVFEHVVRNAQEAAGAAGVVRVTSARTGEHIAVTIADTGAGMDASFIRERLFRPFDTTRGGRGMGIGAYQVREYVREAGGTVEVQSTPGSGTRFIIRLPLCQNTNPAS